jgi:hypothetical protein
MTCDKQRECAVCRNVLRLQLAAAPPVLENDALGHPIFALQHHPHSLYQELRARPQCRRRCQCYCRAKVRFSGKAITICMSLWPPRFTNGHQSYPRHVCLPSTHPRILSAIRDRIRDEGIHVTLSSRRFYSCTSSPIFLLPHLRYYFTRCAVEAKRSPRPWTQKPKTRNENDAGGGGSSLGLYSPPRSPKEDSMSDGQLLRDCGLQHLT